MSSPPYSTHRISECLSEVMDEIGVNETMVMKRRRTWSLIESMETLLLKNNKTYLFGSQIEGSTTPGLQSDIDTTSTPDDVVVIQTVNELKQGCHNLMMIRNENIQPGYCNLQNMSKHSINDPVYSYCEVVDTGGRRLLRRSENKMASIFRDKQPKIHGPALTFQEKGGYLSEDMVHCFSGESLPHEVTRWLQRQRHCKWPNVHNLKNCVRSGCFAVPKGSPESVTPELEWIISTALQERYLMFSLNISQLRCYILMKIFLKTFIDPYVDDVLTSFMCKNVLWYCIANSSQDWHTGNLFTYLQLCLFMLKERLVQRDCPHFIISGNNLLTGRMTDSQQRQLLDIINNMFANGERFLFEIQIDNIGRRLQKKLNNISYEPFVRCRGISLKCSTEITFNLVMNIAKKMSQYIRIAFEEIRDLELELAIKINFIRILSLDRCRLLKDDNLFPHNELNIIHTASNLLIPPVSSVLGSLLACKDIVSDSAISNAALEHLDAGKKSDVSSGRLKLISVLYCTGDIEKTEQELKHISKEFLRSEVLTVCSCTVHNPKLQNIDVLLSFESKHEEAIMTNITFCTRFLHCETPCVPHELRYEILRSYIPEDRQFRKGLDSYWMDTIVVNSVCYYYFLEYKINVHFNKRNEQQQALCNLEASARSYIPHKETSLNLLGQCFEQEGRQIEALQCYIDSLKHCPRNNAAKFMLCIQLYKLKLLKFVYMCSFCYSSEKQCCHTVHTA